MGAEQFDRRIWDKDTCTCTDIGLFLMRIVIFNKTAGANKIFLRSIHYCTKIVGNTFVNTKSMKLRFRKCFFNVFRFVPNSLMSNENLDFLIFL